MSVIRRKVQPIELRLYCDQCGQEMVDLNEGVALTVFPPQYSYKCNSCGFEMLSSFKYPTIIYEYVDDEETEG